MSLLRLANKATKRITLEGGEDYIDVKVDISKRDFNRLIQVLPTDANGDVGFSPDVAENFTTFLFETLVVGWSLVDDAGNPVLPTLETYYNLSRDGALAIDSAVIEHFNSLTPTSEEQRKSEGLGE